MTLLQTEILITAISLLLSLGSLIVLLYQRSSEEQKLASFFSYFSVLSCMGYMGVLLSKGNLEMLIYSTKLKYAGSFSLYMILPLLVKYFHFKTKLLPRIIVNSGIVLVALLVFTFDLNEMFFGKWFFSSYYSEFKNGLPYLHKEYAWGHHLYVALAGIYTIEATVLFIRISKKKKFFDKKNLILLYSIIVSPALFYLAEKIFRFIVGSELIPIVPIGITISNIFFVYLIAVRKFCDVNDLANNALFDLIKSPAIVISKNSLITNINNSAGECFDSITPELIGKSIYSTLPENLIKAYRNLVNTIKFSPEQVASLNADQYLIISKGHTYQPKLREITMGRDLLGYIMWLEDVTLIRQYSQQLEKEVTKKTAELKNNEVNLKLHADKLKQLRDQMIIGFSSLAEHHDQTTEGHLMRTSYYVEAISKKLMESGKYSQEINTDFISNLTHVAPLHDIGKTYISDSICNKPAKLDPLEFEKMKEHTVRGAEFIEQNLKANVDPKYFEMAYNVVKYHHEWWNGKGYPCGLKGTEIPLSARILAVADVYDALRTARPYKEAFSSQRAFSMIAEQKAIHFDPDVVDAFLSIREEIDSISKKKFF